ncbi:hypothetical protein GCM10027271_19640 [Saccharopolyspora gloriosae]
MPGILASFVLCAGVGWRVLDVGYALRAYKHGYAAEHGFAAKSHCRAVRGFGADKTRSAAFVVAIDGGTSPSPVFSSGDGEFLLFTSGPEGPAFEHSVGDGDARRQA